jgi:signal transduction histidine kinase
VATAAAASLLIALLGFGWESARFGFTPDASRQRVAAYVQARFSERAETLDSLASAVAHEGPLIARASGPERSDLPQLFSTLADLSTRLGGQTAADGTAISATVYTAQHVILAWSDGPAEDPFADRLDGPAALFFRQGPLGLLLVAVRPVEVDGRRVGTAVAETVFAPPARTDGPVAYRLTTPFGPVTVSARIADTEAPPSAFALTRGQTALADARVSPDDIDASHRAFRSRWIVVASLPLVALLLAGAGRLLERRRGAGPAAFFLWSLLAAALVAAGTMAAITLERIVAVSQPGQDTTLGLGAVAIVVVLPVSWWWRRMRRRESSRTPLRFAAEQLAAGIAVAALIVGLSYFIGLRIDAGHLDAWQFPIFPLEADSLLYLWGLLLLQISFYGVAVAVLAAMAARWQLDWKQPGPGISAALLWLTPLVIVVVSLRRSKPYPAWELLLAGVAAAGFALAATTFRQYYRRRATQGMRLVLMYGALLAPAIVFYPTAWWYEDRAARALVEEHYAPATEGQTDQLVTELDGASADIDRLSPAMLAQLAGSPHASGPIIPTAAAFQIWSGTGLAQHRITSAVELYGADRKLVSRFALNIPEYTSRAVGLGWEGMGCKWQVFHEVDHFGAEDRPMLHAERGLCNGAGSLTGAVVVHVARDYRSLPFVSSANPYADVLGAPPDRPAGPRLSGLQLVVYGWGYHPFFASGQVAWPIDADATHRLQDSRERFWETLIVEGTTYHVLFSNDRGGIYALGYPSPTPFQHLTRLASAATLTSAIFVLFLVATTLRAPFARRHAAPLAAVFDEIRTSFHRKLFLYFVIVAVVPVLILALAFGAYMAQRFRADVQDESKTTVTVAERVLGELVAIQTPRAQSGAPLTDDVLVWTGRVLERDVNLFDGARLVATSQRGLFDSGLLPMRTPAKVYRAIALDRLPTAVVEDRLGNVPYLVAAAPLRSSGRDAVLSVPLALRQREIQREIDQLSRGVLVGAVFVVLLAAGLGASTAGRIADPVARLTRATRQIARGDLDVRIVADTADELRRLVDDFNSMAATLGAQRQELVRSNQFKAWAEMARQVAHEIKNPLTPIQLAAEHLQRVHEDQHRPLGEAFDQCVTTILRQVRVLRQIAGEFANFAGEPRVLLVDVSPRAIVDDVLAPYRPGLGPRVEIDADVPADLPMIHVDRTLVGRALTNVVENAWQAMPQGGALRVRGVATDRAVVLSVTDTGVGMDAAAVRRAFEPFFSTKTAGSGLGLVNAKQNVERCGGTMTLDSASGRGTTVTITLPRAGTPAVSPPDAPATAR